jgi:glycosyltransferase involved in cell wall biosynthesis
MRIAILSSFIYHMISEIHGKDRIIYGGGEKYLFELCKFLQSENHHVTVYQPISNLTMENGVKKEIPCGQVKKDFRGIPIICLPGYNNWPMGTNPELNRDFNELAGYYDLVIYFTTGLAFPQVHRRSITISHGITWDYSHCSYATMSDNDKQEFLRRHLYGYEAPNICVSVDSNVRRVVQAIKPGAERKIKVISNFVDTNRFVPKEKNWDGIRVLYPRRLTMLRGQNEFIRSAQEHPEYKYIAVGQATNESTEAQAKEYAESRGNIEFTHREMDGMEEIYQNADISVVPTKATEGLSLSLLESMSTGLPVITTPVGGIPDAIIDNYNAMLFDPNHDNLGDFIHYMAQNKGLREVMGARNREIAKCFDIKVWQGRWKQIIDQF